MTAQLTIETALSGRTRYRLETTADPNGRYAFVVPYASGQAAPVETGAHLRSRSV